MLCILAYSQSLSESVRLTVDRVRLKSQSVSLTSHWNFGRTAEPTFLNFSTNSIKNWNKYYPLHSLRPFVNAMTKENQKNQTLVFHHKKIQKLKHDQRTQTKEARHLGFNKR